MAKLRQCVKLLIHVCLIILLNLLLNKIFVKNVYKKNITRLVADMKHILIWTKIHRIEHDGQKEFIDKKCQYINCYVTHNRSLFQDLRYFDVILFNLQDVSEETQVLPHVRGLSQKYVFAANDSADNYPVCNSVYDDFFNWTWSYRSDSTIIYRFISVYNVLAEELGTHFQWIKNMKPIGFAIQTQFMTKSKAAAIFLDKCKSRSKREVFLQKLQTELSTYNLSIDIFGECGTKKCRRKSMAACFWRLKKNYYFYLALEDSLSSDYVTSSVVYAYNNNAVPIVYGAAQYDRFLPPGSYINAMEFHSEQALAKTMYDIISNRQRYYDFFKWRNHYHIKESPVLHICALCHKLNQAAWLKHRVSYVKFRQWWLPNFEKRCSLARNFLVL